MTIRTIWVHSFQTVAHQFCQTKCTTLFPQSGNQRSSFRLLGCLSCTFGLFCLLLVSDCLSNFMSFLGSDSHGLLKPYRYTSEGFSLAPWFTGFSKTNLTDNYSLINKRCIAICFSTPSSFYVWAHEHANMRETRLKDWKICQQMHILWILYYLFFLNQQFVFVRLEFLCWQVTNHSRERDNGTLSLVLMVRLFPVKKAPQLNVLHLCNCMCVCVQFVCSHILKLQLKSVLWNRISSYPGNFGINLSFLYYEMLIHHLLTNQVFRKELIWGLRLLCTDSRRV